MRTLFTMTLTFGVLAALAPLSAQQPPVVKPGAEHAIFKESAGDWDATVKCMLGESKGSQTCKVELNGLWLLEHFKCDLGGAPYEGRGATSYDAGKKKYIGIWIDSMSTTPMISEGTYDSKTKTLTLFGDMPMPEGKTMKATLTTVTKDADTRVFTIKGVGPDGKEAEMLEITYKRRAK